MKLPHLLVIALLLCTACSEEASVDDGGGPTTPPTIYLGHQGVGIYQVAIYQGVKRVLADQGQPVASNVPLVAGRDAVLRVFYVSNPDVLAMPITGRLILENDVEIHVPAQIVPQSNEFDIFSTMNFDIPGDLIGAAFTYQVELSLETTDPNVADNPNARYPMQGLESHAVAGPANTFRVMLAPFQYNADGSGRLPDLSEENINGFRDRLLKLYPVSKVEVTVRAPFPWSQPLGKNGEGWNNVAQTMFGFRNQDGAAADVYYYGTFLPANSMQQYCGQGCLLGVTLLNSDPPDVGNPALRMALGVAYPEVFHDTAAHELMHAHGRGHAPCGRPDPNSIDAGYPYAGGKIGVWGWDIVERRLVDPELHLDVMSYCDPTWISDYHFALLLDRGRNVNLPKKIVPPQRAQLGYQMISFNGEGAATWHGAATFAPTVEPTVSVSVITEGGHAAQLYGHYYSWDHMPGGWLFMPNTERRTIRAELVIDGTFVAATRK
jgi:hypothetical protein